MRPTCLVAVFLCLFAAFVPGQDPAAQAEVFYKHGLVEDAKRLAIQTWFSSAGATQVRCKMLVARIAADERRIDHAVELWQDIAKNHGDTAEGKAAVLLVKQWSTMARLATPGPTENTLANAYLSAATFWMGGIPQNPRFNTSWLRTEEAADFWLRKVVAEFPGTPAMAQALALIARTWLGREAEGQNPGCGAWGLASTPRDRRAVGWKQDFEVRMAKAERAIAELKTAFPDSPEVPQLQFLIAHIYWVQDDYERAQPWLLRCAESNGIDTFWAHLARLRLQNWRN